MFDALSSLACFTALKRPISEPQREYIVAVLSYVLSSLCDAKYHIANTCFKINFIRNHCNIASHSAGPRKFNYVSIASSRVSQSVWCRDVLIDWLLYLPNEPC